MTKAPKIYTVDSGMMAYLIGANEKRLISNFSVLGMLLETFIVMEIEKLISWSSFHLQSYHYRTTSGIDVDLVLENRAGEIIGVEVKSKETTYALSLGNSHYLSDK